MQAVTTIGLDIAKSVFQVHGVDAFGNVSVGRQLKRRQVLVFFEKLPPCLVGLEACASSHHWSRDVRPRRMESFRKSGRAAPRTSVMSYLSTALQPRDDQMD
jgi:transposase